MSPPAPSTLSVRRNRTNELLDVMALALKDVKTDFCERLEKMSYAQEERMSQRLTEVSELATSALEKIGLYRGETEGLIEEISYRVNAVSGRFEKDIGAIDLEPMRGALFSVQETQATFQQRVEDLHRQATVNQQAVTDTGLALKSANDAINEQVLSATGRLDKLEADDAEWRTWSADFQKRVSELEETAHAIVAVADEMRQMREDVPRLNDAIEGLRIKVGAQDTQYQSSFGDLRKGMTVAEIVKRDCIAITDRLEKIEEKALQAHDVEQDFHKQHVAAQAKLAEISVSQAKLQDGDKKLRSEIDALDTVLQSLTQAAEEVTGQIGVLDDRIRDLDSSTTKDISDLSQGVAVLEDGVRNHEQTFSELKDSMVSQETAFLSRFAEMADSREEMAEVLHQTLSEELESRAKVSDRMLVEQATEFITKLSENIRGERGPAGYLSRVQRWVVDYQFPEQALVLHRAGLWQALRDTAQEPRVGEDSDWLPLAVGIDTVSVVPDDVRPGSYNLILEDSAGREHVVELQIPLPRFHKTWKADCIYQHYDSVVEDGHRWLSVTDNPKGPPSRSEDWVLFGMRGARGARGAKGDRGPAGAVPEMDDILNAYTQKLTEGPGIPIFSYRGGWRYGSDYALGDLVQGNRALALCVEAHRAEKDPLTPGQRQWVVLFSMVGPEEGLQTALSTRLEAQEREIVLLRQRIETLSP